MEIKNMVIKIFLIVISEFILFETINVVEKLLSYGVGTIVRCLCGVILAFICSELYDIIIDRYKEKHEHITEQVKYMGGE